MNVKSLLIGILIGVVAIPTISLSGSFVISLIQGKTPTEAVQILAEQIDSLIGRIEIIEMKQEEILQKPYQPSPIPTNFSPPPEVPKVLEEEKEPLKIPGITIDEEVLQNYQPPTK
jgi:hypothetical protein